MNPKKVVTAAEAANLVESGDTLAVTGDGYLLLPDRVLEALEKRFLACGAPRELTEFHPVIVGRAGGGGLDRLSHKGMVRRFIGSSYSIWGMDRMNSLIDAGDVEAYVLPMGAAYHLLRAAAAGQPGVLTEVGIQTFVDPRQEGGRMNAATPPGLVEIRSFADREYLFYPSFPINVAIIRGTTADEDGNISLEEEPVSLGVRLMAMAAKNSRGKVIAQVKRLTARGTMHPRAVEVPGCLVDAIVVDPDQAQRQGPDDPSLTGEVRIPLDALEGMPPGIEKILVRRAALELRPGDIVNVGFGVSVGIPHIVLEEGLAGRVTFTTEHGPLGGFPIDPNNFGCNVNPVAIFDAPSMFDFYHGGGLDITFLSHAQIDARGNVNVSRIGKLRSGCGGFHDITHRTPRLVFSGSLTAKGLQVEVTDGKLRIVTEGRIRKFVQIVEQITLNGPLAWEKQQEVLYVTERAVFRLSAEGPVLIEVAPGISVDDHIRPQVGFALRVADQLRPMDPRIFADEAMGLRTSFTG
jgi:propionate CoA-transferase